MRHFFTQSLGGAGGPAWPVVEQGAAQGPTRRGIRRAQVELMLVPPTVCSSAPSRVYITGSAKGGTTEDFDPFFRKQFPTIARSLGLVIGDREEGIELAQEAFARAWTRWDRYESSEHARNSILRIGINLARSQARKRASITRCSGRPTIGAEPTVRG